MFIFERDARDETFNDLDADDAVLDRLGGHKREAQGVAGGHVFRGDCVGDAVEFGKADPRADQIGIGFRQLLLAEGRGADDLNLTDRKEDAFGPRWSLGGRGGRHAQVLAARFRNLLKGNAALDCARFGSGRDRDALREGGCRRECEQTEGRQTDARPHPHALYPRGL